MVTVDGKKLAEQIRRDVAKETAEIKRQGGNICFAAVVVGDNPASLLYIDKKKKACEEVGIEMRVFAIECAEERAQGEVFVTTAKGGHECHYLQGELNALLAQLSKDKKVNGILLQLPLPQGLDAHEAISYIAPEKDVDGLTEVNFGKLATEQDGLVPCTALGILHILKSSGVNIEGKNVTVIGRSSIVGKPTSLLLLKENATVTVCHSKTKNLSEHTQKADIVIAAAGCPKLVRANMVKQGVVIIDVGINREKNGIVGDVDFTEVSKKASLITPVPGGVGPLTIAFLLKNIIKCFKLQNSV